MKKITSDEIAHRIRYENPWWDKQGAIDEYFRKMVSRAYLDAFSELVTQKDVNRAVVLMGPRRVGKTVLIYHFIQRMIDNGVDPRRICYVSIEAPVYTGCSLEEIVGYYRSIFNFDKLEECYIIFDEIQYLKDWEIHLKRLVDDRIARFVASGSAAAALKRKSMESGAGRFTDVYLPPLTFHEFIRLRGKESLIDSDPIFKINDIAVFNDEFINYINFGGYPEAIFSEAIQSDPGRYIRSDVIDKVLSRDLPSIYGIADIIELNKLFTTIAYNSGNEVSLDALSQSAGIAKNTIKKYLAYLEAAFLVKIIHRVDQSGKRFLKANFFKVYLTNPSIRCALFGPISADHEAMGNMVETAIMSQLFSFSDIFYARWEGGEVDIVKFDTNEQRIVSGYEIKWSNRFFDQPGELQSLIKFAHKHDINDNKVVYCTTIDKYGERVVDSVRIKFVPASVMCYILGRNFAKAHIALNMQILP